MKILALLYDTRAADLLRAAFADLDVEVRHVAKPPPQFGIGLSGPWQRWGDALSRSPDGVFAGAWQAAGGAGAPDVVVLFSGSYALGREALRRQERAPVLVLLDSGHAALEADGTANDPQVVPFAAVAREAARGERVFGYLESDIRTPQTGPSAYASTSQFGVELRRLAGLAPRTGDSAEDGNFLHVDVHGTTGADHGKARDVHGPAFVRRCVYRWRGAAAVDEHAATIPFPDPVPPHVLIARGEVGQSEVAGPMANPRIQLYHSGAVRRGTPTLGANASDEVAWCASFASYCVWLAWAGAQGVDFAKRRALVWTASTRANWDPPGPVTGWRAAVAELVTDARGSGAWRDAGPGVIPAVGWLVVWKRAGGDPRKGGTGHVGIVESVDGARFVAIEGNKSDACRRVEHVASEADLVGWVAI